MTRRGGALKTTTATTTLLLALLRLHCHALATLHHHHHKKNHHQNHHNNHHPSSRGKTGSSSSSHTKPRRFWGSKFIPRHPMSLHADASSSSSSPRRPRQQQPPPSPIIISLQDPHARPAPADVFRRLAVVCDEQDLDAWDVYGDFDLYGKNDSSIVKNDSHQGNNSDEDSSTDDDDDDTALSSPPTTGSNSFLRQFEAQVAADLGMPDAVFMPSGVMAQSIALLVHQAQKRQGQANEYTTADYFVCHSTSHLLLHEQDAYHHLLRMKPIVVETHPPPTELVTPRRKRSSNSETKRHDDTRHQAAPNDDDTDDPVDKNSSQQQAETCSDTLVNPDNTSTPLPPPFPHQPAMGFADVLRTLTDLQWSESRLRQNVAAILVELPHRELGGKLTSYADLQRLSEYGAARQVALHCDGARLWEAAAAYQAEEHVSVATLCALFDSVYISFYKGLGGVLSGAMLLGSPEFCHQARVWLRRMGGNLYTLLPYAVAAYDGYRQNYKNLLPTETTTIIQGQATGDMENTSTASSILNDENEPDGDPSATPPRKLRFTFAEQRDKLREICAQLSADATIARLVSFDPAVPETNMVHGYLHCTAAEGQEWCQWITQATGVQVLRRIKPLDPHAAAWDAGYRSMFEWTMGNANGQVPNDVFVEGWTALAETYLANHVALENGQNPIAYHDNDDEDDDEEDAYDNGSTNNGMDTENGTPEAGGSSNETLAQDHFGGDEIPTDESTDDGAGTDDLLLQFAATE